MAGSTLRPLQAQSVKFNPSGLDQAVTCFLLRTVQPSGQHHLDLYVSEDSWAPFSLSAPSAGPDACKLDHLVPSTSPRGSVRFIPIIVF